jgi:hypothetical protein
MSVKKSATIFTIILTTTILQGCSPAVETNVAKNNNTNQPLQSSNVNAAVNTLNNSGINSNRVVNNNSALAANTKTAVPPPQPAAKTTVGANDMSTFMLIRSKLAADKDLINTVIVEIKEGNVSLTGTVSGDEQKKKAEDIVKSVQGIKTVKNNLKVGQ